jgi:hypothetical protein
MIKIDKDVPMPNGGKRAKYPLGEMEIGDSIFVPGVSNQGISGSFFVQRPKRFSVRTVTEGGVNGVRVWRVE